MTSSCLPKSKLEYYQHQAIGHIIVGGEVGVFLDPGLGKTIIALTAIQELNLAHSWLILCPLRVIDVWEKEIAKWQHTQHLSIAVLHGANKDEVLAGPKKDVYVMNYDGLPWLYNILKKRKGVGAPFNHLIVDESQKIKDPSTNRWKDFKHMIPMFGYRVLLTGTPCGGGGLQGLWSQHFTLDRGVKLGTDYDTFLYRYFHPVDRDRHQWELNEGAEERLWAMLKPRCLSMRAEDHIKLPELIRDEIKIDLPAKVMEQYAFLEQEFFLKLEDDKYIISDTAAVISMKLRQLAQGGIYDEESEWHVLHYEKLEALDALIDELQGSPALVLYQFKGELHMLRERFPDAEVINGDTSETRSKEIVAEWNLDKIPVLFAHPRTVSLGLNMQYGSARNIIWYCPTWSLEECIQVERRLWRRGQKRTVVVHHILAARTIDLAVMRAIRRKNKTQKGLLKALREHRG